MLQFSFTGRPVILRALLAGVILTAAACSGTGGSRSSGSSSGAGAANTMTGGAEGAPTDQATPGAKTSEGVPTTSGSGSGSGVK
jgi:ABC-type sulfate transport system permease subunit